MNIRQKEKLAARAESSRFRGLTTHSVLCRILDAAKTRKQKQEATCRLFGAGLELCYPALLAQNHPPNLGNFRVGNMVFHVAAFPCAADYDRCGDILAAGFRASLVVSDDELEGAAQNVKAKFKGRVGVVSCESFISLAIEESAEFSTAKISSALGALLEKYDGRAEFGKSAGQVV